MLRHLCTFAQRTCRRNTLRQLRQCTDIPNDSFVQSSTRTRKYCESKSTIINENNVSKGTSRPESYLLMESNSEIKKDKKNAEANCTKIQKTETITAVPELLNDRKSRISDEDIELQIPDALDECTEDVSDVVPLTDPPRTFAYIAERSSLVQQLTKLGVKLYKIEKNEDTFRGILQLDFERDLKPRIQFLHDNGVEPADLARVINNYPRILTLDLRILQSRIKYLKVIGFNKEQIGMMITKKSDVLGIPIRVMEDKLRSIQNMFELNGLELRQVVSLQPRVITARDRKVLNTVGYITEVLKFDKIQLKELFLLQPSAFTRNTEQMAETCIYALEEMQLSHEEVLKHSNILLCKKHRLETRHRFLAELNKAQYNPHLPGYIAPSQVTRGTDEEFCKEVANCDIDLYNNFLKTF